jgi:hypothetical protein
MWYQRGDVCGTRIMMTKIVGVILKWLKHRVKLDAQRRCDGGARIKAIHIKRLL